METELKKSCQNWHRLETCPFGDWQFILYVHEVPTMGRHNTEKVWGW